MQAAILLSLVNDLLDISSVRHEIDKREAAGQWVAGRGGAGGSFPMRSEEERVRRANADSDAEVYPSPPPTTPHQILCSFPLSCWNPVFPLLPPPPKKTPGAHSPSLAGTLLVPRPILMNSSLIEEQSLDRVNSPDDCHGRKGKRKEYERIF